MKRMLLVNPELMLPVNTGGRLRTWRFVEALRGRYEISLIHPYRHEHQLEHIADARTHFANVWSVKVGHAAPNPDTLGRRLGRLLRGLPWEMGLNYFPDFAEGLRATLARQRFDVILARYIYQARYLFELPQRRGARIAVDIDDIEPRKIERAQALNRRRSARARARLRLNIALFERYHRRHLPVADLCTVCSEDDRRYLLTRRWSRRVEVVPNTVDVNEYVFGDTPTEQQTLLFCGTLSYEPNVDGLLWFVRNVWPYVKGVNPAVKLSVVGRGAPPEIVALGEDPSIFVHRDVPSVRPYYERASAVIVPIRIGGGTRIKTLEAGACRRPVVSTSIGAEGLDVTRGRHCLIEDDPVEFARACLALLSDAQLARRLAAEYRTLVESTYDTAIVFRKIQRLFDVDDGRTVAPRAEHAA